MVRKDQVQERFEAENPNPTEVYVGEWVSDKPSLWVEIWSQGGCLGHHNYLVASLTFPFPFRLEVI